MAVLGAGITPSLAFSTSCSKPDAPSCATRYGPFDDNDDFENCRRKMRYYQSDVETFNSCTADEFDAVKRELESEREDVRNDVNDAVRSFNRRAGQ